MAHFIKRPNGQRKHYGLVGPNGKAVYDERVDAVNRDLDRGVARDILETRMREIRDSFKRRMPLDADNLKLANACHNYKVIKKGKHLSRPEAAKGRLMQAVAAMASVSLLTATEEAILTQLATVPERSKYHVRGAVNELLAYAKRSLRIFNPSPARPDEIVFVRINEFQAAMKDVPPDYRDYLGALFATGCRMGELPRARLSGESAYIPAQLLRTGKTGPTKNRIKRVAPIIPPLRAYTERISQWAPEKLDMVRLENENDMRKALRGALDIKIHDLRHSYCVEHAAKGANVFELADYIGDTVEVCKRHYRPYCLQDEQVTKALLRWK